MTALALALPLATVTSAGAGAPVRTIAAISGVSFSPGGNYGIVRDPRPGKGNWLYVADLASMVVRKLVLAPNGLTVTSNTVFAGTEGQDCDTLPCGDGGPATSAELTSPEFVSADATGLYISGAAGATIRKVWFTGPNAGNITRIAGNYGSYCDTSTDPCGDGGSATGPNAKLGFVQSAPAIKDGKLYFADMVANRIRCIGCAGAGKLSTVAGTGTVVGTGPGQVTSASADGTRATAANLIGPIAVAIDPKTNEVVFADACNVAAARKLMWDPSAPDPVSYCDGRVRKIVGSGPNKGKLATVAGAAGNITVTPTNWSKQRAANTPLRTPIALAFRADGSLLVAEMGNSLVAYLQATVGGDTNGLQYLRPGVRVVKFIGASRVAANATIEPFAGGKALTDGVVNGGSPLATAVAAIAIEPNPKGNDVYISDQMAAQVRRIRN
ncbi:MAG: hypothetical protein ACOYNI_02440 [Acidimicrobiia bacterium]